MTGFVALGCWKNTFHQFHEVLTDLEKHDRRAVPLIKTKTSLDNIAQDEVTYSYLIYIYPQKYILEYLK